jgi:predicted Zn-dependent protease
MGKANRVYASEIPELLLTHPVSTNRTADALGRAEGYPYTQPEDDLRYQLIRAHLQQRNQHNPDAAVVDFERLLKNGRYRNRTATEYGRVLALMRAKRLQEADKAITPLLEQHPDMTEFIVTKAAIEARLNRTDQALARLANAVLKKPSSYALNLAYAEVAVSRGEFAAALRQLEDYVQYSDDDPKVFQLMSIAAGEQGDKLQAHRLLAEHHYLKGDLEAAILQLEIASKLSASNFYDASRIESRLKTLREEEAAKEARE